MVRACVCPHCPGSQGQTCWPGLLSGFPSQPPATCRPGRLQDFPFLKHTSQVMSSSTWEKPPDLRTETEGHSGPFRTSRKRLRIQNKGVSWAASATLPTPTHHGSVGIFRHRLKSSWSALTSTPQTKTLPPFSPKPEAPKAGQQSLSRAREPLT